MLTRIAIVIADSNSACSVPAVKGGAVASLVEHLIAENSKEHQCEFTVFSYFDEDAAKAATKYKNVDFCWIRVPKVVKKIDSFLFLFVTKILKKQKAISYKRLASLIYYILCVSFRLKESNCNKVVLENNIVLSWVIRLNGNIERYKGRCYYHLHNIPRINAKNRLIFNDIEKFLCVSQYVAGRIMSSSNPIGPVPKEKIAVVKNCIDAAKFKKESISENEILSLRKELEIADQDIVLLFVGRLSKEKGVDQVVKALDHLNDLPVKLIIVGNTLSSGEIKDAFLTQLQEETRQHQKQIKFTGYMSQDKVRVLYNISDFAILPSMWDEPAGLTMIEAMAAGKVVITTNSGGIPEYTQPGASIILDRENNLPVAIADTVRYYVAHPEEYAQVCRKGQKVVYDTYNLNHYLSSFLGALGETEHE